MEWQAEIQVGLRHSDIDELGHVNQAVYHVLLEEVRVAVVEAVMPDLPHTGFALVRSELDYRREVRISAGVLTGQGRIVRVGTSSFQIEHRLLHPDGQVAAEGSSVLIAWDGEARRSRPLSEIEKKQLNG